jgi:large conductance mechanosensitive channel
MRSRGQFRKEQPVLAEFKEFLTKTNALALAIGVIIGSASGKVVSSLVDNIMMPLISIILPPGDWRGSGLTLSTKIVKGEEVPEKVLTYGAFIGSLIDFIIIALVVFMITKYLLKPTPEPEGPGTKECPFCLDIIPAGATRCKSCTSQLV